MSRDVVARLDDMIEAAEYVVAWTTGRVADDLADDVGLRFQIERALEVLGEAAKHVPEDVRTLADEFPWRKACGLRDVLAHAYFDVDPEVLVSVGLESLPRALPALHRLRALLAAGSAPKG